MSEEIFYDEQYTVKEKKIYLNEFFKYVVGNSDEWNSESTLLASG